MSGFAPGILFRLGIAVVLAISGIAPTASAQSGMAGQGNFSGGNMGRFESPGAAHAAMSRMTGGMLGSSSQSSAAGRLFMQTSAEASELIRACRSGTAAACMAVGDLTMDQSKPMVLNGHSRENAAFAYFGHACSTGHAESCARATGLISATASMRSHAYRYGPTLQRGCALDVFAACSLYGSLFFDEAPGGPETVALAVDFLAHGCAGGDVGVCAPTAQMLVSGTEGVTVDPVRGASLYQSGCIAKDAVSCYNLAMMQLNGRGIAADEAEGLANLQRAHGLDPELAPASAALQRRGLLD